MKYFIALFFVFFMIAPSLNPLADGMFSFHDPTQVGRVTSFTNNLKTFHIPPRLAPELSFGLGFPVFNFYAPSAYWITSSFALMGFSSVVALKLSFFLAVCISFFGMYFCLTQLFGESSKHRTLGPLIGAAAYVSSTYFATEIIVRGNLAETWFLALFPLVIGLQIVWDKVEHRGVFFLTTITMALLFTVHNVLSLFGIAFVFLFGFFSKSRQKQLMVFTLALCLDAYFFIPAFWEGNLVQAARIAKEYPYAQHFLCAWQLWSAPRWEFGGSLPGCETDTMSFKVGKLQLILALFGLLLFILDFVRVRKKTLTHFRMMSIAVLSIGSFFLTLEYSAFIWKLGSAIMAIFQFPWRFIALGLIGIGVFAGYLFHRIRVPFSFVVFLVMLALFFLPARKYFVKPLYSYAEYDKEFNSVEYLQREAAFKMKEYLVSVADYSTWNRYNPENTQPVSNDIDASQVVVSTGSFSILKNSTYQKQVKFHEAADATVQLHYFPFWNMKKNGASLIPKRFDTLGRPVITVEPNDIVSVEYQQTFIEYFANGISVLTLIIVLFICKKLPH